MTLHDVRRLHNHWRKNPPLRTLVAACASALGVKIKLPDEKPLYMTAEEAMALKRIGGGKIAGVGSM